MPVLPPLDHTFRYYEPENSYFRLRIPPFLQLIEPGLKVRCSSQLATVTIDEKTAEVKVQARTGNALSKCNMLVFIYDNEQLDKLEATIRIEVTPLACFYA